MTSINDDDRPAGDPDGPEPVPPDPHMVEFESFYRGHFAKLVTFLIYLGAGLQLAGDIAQEAMRLLWLHRSEVRFRKAWTWKVAKREYVRFRQAHDREVPVGSTPRSSWLLLDTKDIAEFELRHEIIKVLRALPPVQREIMILTLLEYSPSEIAAMLDKSPEAVRSSLRKARRKIWHEIYGDEECHDDDE